MLIASGCGDTARADASRAAAPWSSCLSACDEVALAGVHPGEPADLVSTAVTFDLDCASAPFLPDDRAAASRAAAGGPSMRVDPGVRLHASPSRLAIELGRPLETCDPRESILLRWWINGRAIAPRSATHAAGGEGGPVIGTRHLRLDLVRVMEAIGARRGDAVGVQALICPNGWVPAGSGKGLTVYLPDPWPRLSPRVDFTVP